MDPTLPRGLLCFLAALLLLLATSPGVQGQGDRYLTCYSYTWTGKNVSVDCEEHKVDIMNEAQPCLDTLVYTVPYQQPPNTSDIKAHCETEAKCPAYTCKEKKNCVKVMWYDITNTLVNYSSFCGSVIDNTVPSSQVEVENALLEMQVGTYTKKVWVCNQDLCNDAGALAAPSGLSLMGLLLLPLLLTMVLNLESVSLSSLFSTPKLFSRR